MPRTQILDTETVNTLKRQLQQEVRELRRTSVYRASAGVGVGGGGRGGGGGGGGGGGSPRRRPSTSRSPTGRSGSRSVTPKRHTSEARRQPLAGSGNASPCSAVTRQAAFIATSSFSCVPRQETCDAGCRSPRSGMATARPGVLCHREMCAQSRREHLLERCAGVAACAESAPAAAMFHRRVARTDSADVFAAGVVDRVIEIAAARSAKARLRSICAAWHSLGCSRQKLRRAGMTDLLSKRHRLLLLAHRFADWRLACAREQRQAHSTSCPASIAASDRQDLQEVRRICAQQEAEILELKAKHGSAQQHCLELQARCAELANEANYVRTQSNAPQHEVLMLRELCSKQNSELCELREKRKSPQSELLELSRLCEEQVVEIEGLRRQVLAPQHDLQELQAVCQQQALQIQNLNKIDEAPEDEIISLQATCDQQAGELEELRKQLQEERGEVERLRGLCGKRDVAFEALKRQAEEVQELYTLQRAEIETMQAEVESKSRDLQQLQGLRALCEQQALQIEQLRCSSRPAEVSEDSTSSGSREVPDVIVTPSPNEEMRLAPQAPTTSEGQGLDLSGQVKLEDEADAADPPACTPRVKRCSPDSSSSALAKTLAAPKPAVLSAEITHTSPRPASETSAHSSCPSPQSAVVTPSRLQTQVPVREQVAMPCPDSASSKTTMRRFMPAASRSISLPATANVGVARVQHLQAASGFRFAAAGVAAPVTVPAVDVGVLLGQSPRGRPCLSAAIPNVGSSAAPRTTPMPTYSSASTAQTCITAGTRRAVSQPPQRLDASAFSAAMRSVSGASTPRAATPQCAGAASPRLAAPCLSTPVGFAGKTTAPPIVIAAPTVSPIAAAAAARAAAASTVVAAGANATAPRAGGDGTEHLVAAAATPQRHASSSMPRGIAAGVASPAAPHLVAAVAARQAELARSRATPGVPQGPLSAVKLWEQQAAPAPGPQRLTPRSLGCSAVRLDAAAAPALASTGCLAASPRQGRTNTLT